MTSTPPTRRSLSFGRRLAISLTATALVPLVVFGSIAIGRVDEAVTVAAESRVRDALAAVETIVADREQALLETATAYADWSVTRQLIDAGDLDTVQHEILGFVEARGSADVAIAVLDGKSLTTGSDPEAAAIAELARDSVDRTGIAVGGGGLYQFAVAGITESSPSAGAHTGSSADIDLVIVADRLDAAFAHDVRRLTGFDIAIVDPGGAISLAGDPLTAARFASAVTGTDGATSLDGMAAGWDRVDAVGGSAAFLVTTRDESVRAVLGQLPAVLVLTLALAAFASVVVASAVAHGLNLRLSAIHGGLTAIAAGRRPAKLPSSGGRDVDRLAEAVDGLVVASDRRERILREASLAIAELRPDIGEAAVAQAAVDGAVEIFHLATCALLGPGGAVMASAPAHVVGLGHPDEPGRAVESPLASVGDDGGWLTGIAPSVPPWTDADDALFGLYARLIGGAMHDARVYDVTSDRLVELGRMNEFQRQFLRSVSHNLQTPITTISLVADDLADPTADPTPSYRERQIRVVRTQARRLEHLVAQLITVSRLDAGRLHLERDVVAIEPLVRRVWAALDSERALAFSDEAPDRIVVGDRDALEQILWILFDNAVRYAPTGRVGVTIAADDVGGMAEADGGPARPPRIRIDVADEGPGIPESEQRNIFRRFWSGSAGRGQGGAGIGLDIARRLSRAMGGSLRYEPGRPTGAVFVLTLPAELARPD